MSQCTGLHEPSFEKEGTQGATAILSRAIERGVYQIDLESDLRLGSITGMENAIPFRLRSLVLKDYPRRIECYGFSFDKPWLSPNILKLLGKLKTGSITEKEALKLMGLVAERATAHFQLPDGKFVALTFRGRIVETSDSRVGLLKKIQNRKQEEQIFVWRIGSNAFSGRL